MAPLRVGIVGCGEAAQALHLPALDELRDLFTLTALCDASAHVAGTLAARRPGVAAGTDAAALVARSDVDVVLVAAPHVLHAEVTLAALAAGKPVLVEKPLCVSLAEGEAIAAAADRAGVPVQVGYMRRHAEAFLQARDWLALHRPVLRLARFHDIVGRNATIVADVAAVVRPTDLSRATTAAFVAEERRRMAAAIGSERPDLLKAYGQLLGLLSHDLSAMRELVGPPRGLLHAWQRHGGVTLGLGFDYGDAVAEVVSGVDEIPRYDAAIELFAASEVLRVDYAPPYLRHAPALLTVTRASGSSGVEVSRSFPSRADPFVAEWRAFHAAVIGGAPPKTSVADSLEDLRLMAAVMAALSRTEAEPPAVVEALLRNSWLEGSRRDARCLSGRA